MPKRQEEWITSQQAADILTARSNHIVTPTYVRHLAKVGKIETKDIDLRTKLYLKSDVEAYQVKQRGDGSVRGEARAKKSEKVA
jgi:hypothetical protein